MEQDGLRELVPVAKGAAKEQNVHNITKIERKI